MILAIIKMRGEGFMKKKLHVPARKEALLIELLDKAYYGLKK